MEASMRTTFALSLVSFLAAFPLAASAKGGGGSHSPQHTDLTITKKVDKSSPNMMMQRATPKGGPAGSNTNTHNKK
jgi:hypothetical protein